MALAELKEEEHIAKKFYVESRLFQFINIHYEEKNSPLQLYMKSGDWDFIRDWEKMGQMERRLYRSKSLLDNTYKTNAKMINVFSPIIFNERKDKAMIVYEKRSNQSYSSAYGFLFFSKSNNHWLISKKIVSDLILD